MMPKGYGTVRWSHVDYIACSARDLNPCLITFKQTSSWFTASSQENLLEKLITTTGAATGKQTRVSKLAVRRANYYTIAEEWYEQG